MQKILARNLLIMLLAFIYISGSCRWFGLYRLKAKKIGASYRSSEPSAQNCDLVTRDLEDVPDRSDPNQATTVR